MLLGLLCGLCGVLDGADGSVLVVRRERAWEVERLMKKGAVVEGIRRLRGRDRLALVGMV